MTKTIRRFVYIREYDYERMFNKALKLYDSVNFEPLTKTQINHLETMELLRNPDAFKSINMPDWSHCQSNTLRWDFKYLARKINKMYNVNYANWTWGHDNETDFIYIQAKTNGPKSPVGIAWFEKDV